MAALRQLLKIFAMHFGTQPHLHHTHISRRVHSSMISFPFSSSFVIDRFSSSKHKVPFGYFCLTLAHSPNEMILFRYLCLGRSSLVRSFCCLQFATLVQCSCFCFIVFHSFFIHFHFTTVLASSLLPIVYFTCIYNIHLLVSSDAISAVGFFYVCSLHGIALHCNCAS